MESIQQILGSGSQWIHCSKPTKKRDRCILGEGSEQLISRPLIDAVGNALTNEWAFTCWKLTFSSSAVYCLLLSFSVVVGWSCVCVSFTFFFKFLRQILYFIQPGSHKPLISIGGILMYFLLCCGLDETNHAFLYSQPQSVTAL